MRTAVDPAGQDKINVGNLVAEKSHFLILSFFACWIDTRPLKYLFLNLYNIQQCTIYIDVTIYHKACCLLQHRTSSMNGLPSPGKHMLWSLHLVTSDDWGLCLKTTVWLRHCPGFTLQFPPTSFFLFLLPLQAPLWTFVSSSEGEKKVCKPTCGESASWTDASKHPHRFLTVYSTSLLGDIHPTD